MATAALIGGVMTKMFTGENPKDTNDYISPRVGGTNPDGSPRRLTTMLYLREIPMFQKHMQEHGGGIGGVLAGGKDMLLSKMLFGPFIELMNNRNYFGQEIWDTNAPGFQRLMQALHHVWTGQLSPMSVSGAQRAEESMGIEPKWYPTTKEGALSWLGFGPAPKYAESSALQNRIAYLYKEHVALAARPYTDEANTREKLLARDKLLLAQQSGDGDKLNAAVRDMLAAGYKAPSAKQSLAGLDLQPGGYSVCGS